MFTVAFVIAKLLVVTVTAIKARLLAVLCH